MTDTRTPYDAIKAYSRLAAKSMAMLSGDQWPGWIVYYLEVLDSKHYPDFERTLAAVKKAIDIRLAEGHW